MMQHVYTTMLVGCMAWAASAVEVDVNPQKYRVSPGEVFPVAYTVFWTGAADAYAVQPVVLPDLDWGTADLLETRTRTGDERQEVQLIIGYRADAAGDFETPVLSIRVQELEDIREDRVTPLPDDAPSRILEAPGISVRVRRFHVGFWTTLLVLLLAAVGGVWYLLVRRRAAQGGETPAQTPLEQAHALLHDGRRCRLDGDFYGYYRALQQALTCVSTGYGDSDAALRHTLQQRIDDTGYRGKRPTEDELEGDFKDVERQIAHLAQRELKEK